MQWQYDLLAVPGVLLAIAVGIAAVLYDAWRAHRSRRDLPYTASSVRELLESEEET